MTPQAADTPCGRFAPSPSGPLHFGSLIAAVASFIDARHRGGRWLVRIEDVDTPRTVPGAADTILRALEDHALAWDGEVLYQSRRTEAYAEAAAGLRQRGLAFACTCTRSELAQLDPAQRRYPGTCRQGPRHPHRPAALRLRCDGAEIHYTDRILGPQRERLAETCGDFPIRRADGLHTYQLAVVVDDLAQGVTDIVRGADLLDSTARQIHLMQLLGAAPPSYAHLPLAIDDSGIKLSKRSGAEALDGRCAAGNLVATLAFLGQRPPPGLTRATPAEVLAWGLAHWRLDAVPRSASATWPRPSNPRGARAPAR